MDRGTHGFRSGVAAMMMVFAFVAVWGGRQADAQSAPRATSPVADIVRDPAEVPPSVGARAATTVRVELVTQEMVGELERTTGTTYRYWTFNGKVPGPMIRVREGDTVEVRLRNEASSHMVHSVDFHAAMGPGGGAALSQALPGQEKVFTFVATTPGLYVYHCGTPMIGDHIANGMYGLILVEPAGGMPHVDREYYVMQGEIYTAAPKGKAGLQNFSEAKLLQEQPEYLVFNGAVDALMTQHPLRANTGESVRIFFGDAGPNATSSFHVVGEIFSHYFQFGSLTSPPINGVQTASVPAGGAAILELTAAMPGKFAFMDHAMARMPKGLMGALVVMGQQTANLMHAGPADASGTDVAAATVPQAPPAPGDAHDHMGMMMETTTPAAAVPPAMTPVRPANSAGPVELDGCLTLAGGSRLRLTAFRSSKSYALEPRAGLLTERPLEFAQNLHTLVHVSGHLEPLPGPDGRHWFTVDSVLQLAPTCESTASLAQLRSAARARLVRARADVSSSAGASVDMSDMAFLQRDVQIEAGQTVTWKNTSSTIHNVVTDAAKATIAGDARVPSGARAFDSGYLQPGRVFTHTFTVPGVYHYVCTLHEASGMKGTVVVRAAGAVPELTRAQAGGAHSATIGADGGR
jgi:copper-containing nitrite reductase